MIEARHTKRPEPAARPVAKAAVNSQEARSGIISTAALARHFGLQPPTSRAAGAVWEASTNLGMSASTTGPAKS